ncbi:MAG: DUF503 domain-containing protein [Lentisphaeria bacterium]|nr:DUF503 domain-containing protein [Lentisphaeria bacterium]NQZ69236.1 DUF503 domain-containing protein [Lentisphaeria bacterium]
MILGILRIELDIDYAQSLKDKRSVLNRIKDRMKNKFNVSIAEVGSNEIWNYADIAIAHVSNDQRFSNQVLDKVIDHIEKIKDCEIADYSMDFQRMD